LVNDFLRMQAVLLLEAAREELEQQRSEVDEQMATSDACCEVHHDRRRMLRQRNRAHNGAGVGAPVFEGLGGGPTDSSL
jgi:hypothetical protein